MKETFSNTHTDEQILRFLSSQVEEFKNHLTQVYLSDQRTHALLSKLTGVGLLVSKRPQRDGTYNSGMFDHSTGMLYVSPRDGYGRQRSIESLNKSIVHELGHGTRNKYAGETSHSTEWKQAWKFFLKIATEELGWSVEAPCSSHTFYGLEYQDCPECLWEVDYDSCPLASLKK